MANKNENLSTIIFQMSKSLSKRSFPANIYLLMRRFGVLIVNFEHISHLWSSVSIVNFEYVIAGWVHLHIIESPKLIGCH